MSAKTRINILTVTLAALTALPAQSQSKSAIEFYDQVGTAVTSRFGWQGGAVDGYFFIETPGFLNSFKLQGGNLTLGGILTANKFIGDGSGLTGLPSLTELDPTVPATLKDGVSWEEIQGIPAGFADGVDNEGTGGTAASGSSAEQVANELMQNAAFLTAVKGKDGAGPTVEEVTSALMQNATFLAAVKGETGPKGSTGLKGEDGKPCSVSKSGAAATIVCGTTTVEISDGSNGTNGVDGKSCTVSKSGATATISCGTTTATISDGQDGITQDLSGCAKLSGAKFSGPVTFNGDVYTYSAFFADELSISDGFLVGAKAWVTFNGRVDLDGGANVRNGLTVAGGCTGCTQASSDKRLKKDIENITSPLEKVQKIKGVNFSWKKEEFPERRFTEKRQVGVIAQDVEVVIPEAVSKDEEGHYLVDYAKLVPLLLEAIKEQQNQIQDQKGQIKSAKIEVALLKEKFERQEKMIEHILNEISGGKNDRISMNVTSGKNRKR